MFKKGLKEKAEARKCVREKPLSLSLSMYLFLLQEGGGEAFSLFFSLIAKAAHPA